MEIKELYEKIRDNAFTTRRGLANSVNHSQIIDRMKNILYNNLTEIEAALKYAADASDKIRILELELDDAERELDELNKKTTRKTTKKSSTSDE